MIINSLLGGGDSYHVAVFSAVAGQSVVTLTFSSVPNQPKKLYLYRTGNPSSSSSYVGSSGKRVTNIAYDGSIVYINHVSSTSSATSQYYHIITNAGSSVIYNTSNKILSVNTSASNIYFTPGTWTAVVLY